MTDADRVRLYYAEHPPEHVVKPKRQRPPMPPEMKAILVKRLAAGRAQNK